MNDEKYSLHTYVTVKTKHYKKYIEQYGHNKLAKFLHLEPDESCFPIFARINEVFDLPLETEYVVSKNQHDYVLYFESKSHTKYRIDLLKDPTEKVYHLAFSLADRIPEEYEMPTAKREIFDVLNRMVWILKDFTKKKLENVEFCIGATNNIKKNKLYQYILKYAESWEKRNSTEYDEGWALYFKI